MRRAARNSKVLFLSNATVLINEAADIEGLRIWGSPVTPLFGGAFGMNSPEDRRRLYAQIPKDTDVVVTHGPPYRILDASPEYGVHSGCRELFDVVMRVQPRLHVFGHVHGGFGIFQTEHTTFVNAALLGMHGDLNKAPAALKMSRE
jgi:Icc-related predicted phosphoesterase